MRTHPLQHKTECAEISEIFSSLQGEGPYLGVRQIFVRFGRCNMHCHYCDELDKMKAERFQSMSAQQILEGIEKLHHEEGEPHSISLTGGEPLFYTPFLENFLPVLKQKGYRTYLETNGTLPRELERVLKYCDIIAMDMKPASSTGDRAFWKAHENFLKKAICQEVFVKTVITPETHAQDVERCVRIVASINPKIPFIFQPLSEPFGISLAAMDLIQSKFFDLAKKHLWDVRVIPQMHKIWGVR